MSQDPRKTGSQHSFMRNSQDMAQSQTRFLHVQKVTPGVVRSIFDSVYLRPEENPRVINYHDPAKAHIIDDATKRYEQKKAEDDSRNAMIQARINSDNDRHDEHFRQSQVIFKEQQKQTRQQLLTQSEAKQQFKTMEAAYEDTMRKTSFAPQEPQREVELRMQQKKH